MHQIGDTYWTENGSGRTTYHPDYSPSSPWLVFVRGTAMVHCVNRTAAESVLRQYGCGYIHLPVNELPVCLDPKRVSVKVGNA